LLIIFNVIGIRYGLRVGGVYGTVGVGKGKGVVLRG